MTSRFIRGVVGCVALALIAAALTAEEAAAITITMEYSDEGSPLPHPENPSWDPGGLILKQHFQRAKEIWEALLPGPGDFEFDFQWDDDISGLGLTTDLGAIDVFIEINPTYQWYADKNLSDDSDFSLASAQGLFSGLSPTNQATYFPGTAPPPGLEVRYRGAGIPYAPLNPTLDTRSASGQLAAGTTTPVDASNGYDLLSTIVHEMGHVLGIGAEFGSEPGEYNILPDHVGGLQNVLVKEGDGGHLAGHFENQVSVPGWLMCDGCGSIGQRRFPTATDVLVVAGDQDISQVHLARVGSLSSGFWNEPGRWIGNASPDGTQGVYISHGGSIALSANAQALDVRVDPLNSLLASNNVLDVKQSLALAGGTISVGAGGTIAADSITHAANDLTTAAGSLVRFNSLTGGSGPQNFAGSVAIGYSNGKVGVATFDPAAGSTWNIAQELAVGDEAKAAVLVVNENAHFTSATGRLGGTGGPSGSSGEVRIDGNGSTWTVTGALTARNGGVTVTNQGRLNTGSAVIGAGAGLANMDVDNGEWEVGSDLDVGPATPVGDGGGTVTVRNSGTIHVPGNVSVRGTPARTAQINVRSAGSLNIDGDVTVGSNGVVAFYDEVRAQGAMIGAASYDNLGGAINSATGGITQFNDQASAGGARFSNRGGGSQFAAGGRTEFRNFSTAAFGRFDNYASTAGLYPGVTRFFDFATAGNADFFNHPGPLSNTAAVEFNGDSTGGDARFTNLAGVLGQSVGGAFIFNDRSTAGRASYITQGEGGYVTFNDSASADHGTFAMADAVSGNSRIAFMENSTAANATFSMGANTILSFLEYSTAANAHLTLRRGSSVTFNGAYTAAGSATNTAGNAFMVLDGGASIGGSGGAAYFNTYSTAGNATITANGGTVAGAGGATVNFDYVAHAGNATIIANGGTNGGAGATVYFRRGATGDNARLVVNQGAVADFGGNFTYDFTSIGSIEGAGTFATNGTDLRVGSLNTTTIVSGPVVDVPGSNTGGRFTKIGTGKLTLAGANTYTGLTTVDAGTLAITGSVVGGALVKSGATLSGTGTIAGAVTVAPGGILSPGSSPGTLTVGGLNLAATSVLNFEIGATSDKLAVDGHLTLDGIINISSFAASGIVDVDLLTYSGNLTNNGLTIGSVPAGFSSSDFSIDASEPGRVRLLGGGLTADFDGDGVVEVDDLARWRLGFGISAGALRSQGDADADGDIDGSDFLAWQRQLGGGTAAAASWAAPEPISATIAILSTLALTNGRRGDSRGRKPVHGSGRRGLA